MLCPQCHYENSRESNYCILCGTLLPLEDGGAKAEKEAEAPASHRVLPSQLRTEDTGEIPAVRGAASTVDYRSQEVLDIPDTRDPMPAMRFALGLVCVFGIIAVIALFVFGTGIVGKPTVPDVVGMSRSAAISRLEDAGFKTDVTLAMSEETAGTVILTDPAAQTRADQGSTVVLQVATPRTVPDVAGKTLEEAKTLLEERGYTDIAVKYKNSEKTKGTVLSVSPSSGSKLRSDETVTLTVASEAVVPDILGMTQEEALAALEEEGYEATVEYVADDTVEAGTVESCSPEVGEELKPGSSVTVRIADGRGSELIALTEGLFAGDVVIAGVVYHIDEVSSLTYAGNDCVAYTVIARPVTYYQTGAFYGEQETLSGTVQFDEQNYCEIY